MVVPVVPVELAARAVNRPARVMWAHADAAVKVAVVASVAMAAQARTAMTLLTEFRPEGLAVWAASGALAVSAAWAAHRAREVARPRAATAASAVPEGAAATAATVVTVVMAPRE